MKKRNKIYIFLLCAILLVSPLIINLFHFNRLGYNFILESSIFGFDYSKLFAEFFYDKSLFVAGNNAVTAISHVFLYGILYVLQIFFTPISSFFIFLIAAIITSYYFFIKLFNELADIVSNKKNDQFYFVLVCILGLIFFASISNFIFLSATVVFLLPVLLLPIQLYFIKRYAINDEKKGLMVFIILNFFNTFNITSFLINAFFVNILLYILLNLRYGVIVSKNHFNKIIFANILYLPFLAIFGLQLFLGSMYIGSFGDVANSIREDFYSNNASYLSIFSQTNYWGLFGSFNGKLYYDFSKFYKNSFVYIFAFIPYLLILFFLIKSAKKKYNDKLNKLIVYLFLLFLFIFQFMLGLKNPVYKFLYDNITIFQIFRNITKFAPLLLFLTILILFLLIIRSDIKSIIKKWLLLLIILLSLIYNLPYWTYHSYFFENRAMANIPQNYLDTAGFLNKQLNHSDNVLVLPATYSLESYVWNDKKVAVQGDILDVLLDNGIKSYRLTQGFSGNIFFRKDSTKLFIKTDTNARKLDIDYNLLSDFVKKYNLNYIVVTKELVSEYQNLDVLNNWLSNNNYNRINSFGSNDIYLNKDFSKPILLSSNDIYFERKNAKNYSMHIKSGINFNLTFFEAFNKYWNLYLEPFSEKDFCNNGIYNDNTFNVIKCQYKQKIVEKGELSYLWKKPIFDNTHKLVYDYANQWTIDPDYIKANFDKSYYKENPDGSIDLELTLYFKPQSYFYLGLIISGTTLLGCVGYLIFIEVKKRKRKKLDSRLRGNDKNVDFGSSPE